MLRFHSVATSYLPNYLGCFRGLDGNAQTGVQTPSLLAFGRPRMTPSSANANRSKSDAA